MKTSSCLQKGWFFEEYHEEHEEGILPDNQDSNITKQVSYHFFRKQDFILANISKVNKKGATKIYEPFSKLWQ